MDLRPEGVHPEQPSLTHPLPYDVIHYFSSDISHIPLPEAFTYPFCYTPHPLCQLAATEVQHYLSRQSAWQEELQAGKMFGVLVVRGDDHRVGFLAAYSGNLCGRNDHPYFVPPVYDLLRPEGYFKQEEARISALNREILRLEHDPCRLRQLAEWQAELAASHQRIEEERQRMQEQKSRRDALRQRGPITPEQEEQLIRESQRSKSLFHQLKQQEQTRQRELQAHIEAWHAETAAAKAQRKRQSAALQRWLFSRFIVRNARGEQTDLNDLFAPTPQGAPPAGAGECAAPKLLQQAYLHGWQPLCMAEFWWGNSPKAEIREHGHYYPACQGKCGPILGFMLQGLEVESHPLIAQMKRHGAAQIEILYEDEYLCAVNKPAGMLSVPGKEQAPSIQQWAEEHLNEGEMPRVVHRLDMATSGLLLIAKRPDIYRQLQEQFATRQVSKRYVAILESIPQQESGEIALPLAPDLLNRPYQVVDEASGKPALTQYTVLEHLEGGRCRVAFHPHTGRTHQLRVHAAHAKGLHCPIVGDTLYGHPADRLYLHAERLDFTHPVTGQRITLQCKAEF